ncbi:MAG: cyclic nucleotide-binding domain-containing protein, partial [Eubacteriales bacterium]
MKDPFPILENKESNIELKFLKIGICMEFMKTDLILEAGKKVKGIYYITEGKVDCYRISVDGRKKTTLIEGPGAILSDVLLIDGEPQPCNYQALERVRAIYIDKNTLAKAIYIDSSIN